MSTLDISNDARMALAELVQKAAQEWLDDVAELAVEDIAVEDLADHIAARVCYGWPERELHLVHSPRLELVPEPEPEADPTPPFGILRPDFGVSTVVGHVAVTQEWLDAETWPGNQSARKR